MTHKKMSSTSLANKVQVFWIKVTIFTLVVMLLILALALMVNFNVIPLNLIGCKSIAEASQKLSIYFLKYTFALLFASIILIVGTYTQNIKIQKLIQKLIKGIVPQKE